jgi:dihydrodipicolinate synthase/N-acetylneuraminate lyase
LFAAREQLLASTTELTAKDLSGVLAMMPAFSTPDAVDIRATQTIAVDNLKEGVDRIIKDGAKNIATTGTYGECYNLLFEEFSHRRQRR